MNNKAVFTLYTLTLQFHTCFFLHILPIQATAIGQPGFLKPSKRNKEDSVRVRTLNNIIYKAATDLLSSYEVNSEISAYNVQISKVGYVLSSKFHAIINYTSYFQ